MNRIEIKKWMIEIGVNQTELAKKAGVGDPTVSLVIKGKRKSNKVLNTLVELGCPKRLLGKTRADEV